jgi:hypothetical protein
VEFSKTIPTDQEVELSAQKLPASTKFTLVIDGKAIARGTADEQDASRSSWK